jgi:hypothetical protein
MGMTQETIEKIESEFPIQVLVLKMKKAME